MFSCSRHLSLYCMNSMHTLILHSAGQGKSVPTCEVHTHLSRDTFKTSVFFVTLDTSRLAFCPHETSDCGRVAASCRKSHKVDTCTGHTYIDCVDLRK